jgi:hypothetical protein
VLLAAGLYGEAGSILSELKKSQREGSAYPHYRQRLAEEFGDALWYFVRLVAKCDPGLLTALPRAVPAMPSSDKGIASSLRFGAAVGDVLRKVQQGPVSAVRTSLDVFWAQLLALAAEANVELKDAAAGNVQSPVPVSPNEAEAIGQPLLRNLLPWPDEPRLPLEDLEQLASTLRVEKAGLPPELTRHDERARHQGAESPCTATYAPEV